MGCPPSPQGERGLGEALAGFLGTALLGVGVIVLVWAILDRRCTVYTVTTRRVIEKRGIIGRYISEVELRDIRNVLLQCGILERLFGIGSIGLGTAGQAGIEVKLKGVDAPESVRRLIADAKDGAA